MVWNVTATRAAGGICYFIPILPCRSSFAAPCTWWGRHPRSSGSWGDWVCLQPHLRTASSSSTAPRVRRQLSAPATEAVQAQGRWRVGAWRWETFPFFFFFLSVATSPAFWLWRSKGLALSLCLSHDLYNDTPVQISPKDGLGVSKGQLQILNFADVCIWSACVNNVFESWALSQAVMLLHSALGFDGIANSILAS